MSTLQDLGAGGTAGKKRKTPRKDMNLQTPEQLLEKFGAKAKSKVKTSLPDNWRQVFRFEQDKNRNTSTYYNDQQLRHSDGMVTRSMVSALQFLEWGCDIREWHRKCPRVLRTSVQSSKKLKSTQDDSGSDSSQASDLSGPETRRAQKLRKTTEAASPAGPIDQQAAAGGPGDRMRQEAAAAGGGGQTGGHARQAQGQASGGAAERSSSSPAQDALEEPADPMQAVAPTVTPGPIAPQAPVANGGTAAGGGEPVISESLRNLKHQTERVFLDMHSQLAAAVQAATEAALRGLRDQLAAAVQAKEAAEAAAQCLSGQLAVVGEAAQLQAARLVAAEEAARQLRDQLAAADAASQQHTAQLAAAQQARAAAEDARAAAEAKLKDLKEGIAALQRAGV